MTDAVMSVAFLLAIVGVAAAFLFARDFIGKRFSKPLALIVRAVVRFVRPALVATLVVVVGAVLVGTVSENWGDIVCWANDETGSLTRTCALHKIVNQAGYGDAYVVEITGIADMSENVKRVEFKWRPKPDAQSPSPQSSNGYVTFRKCDDGWRLETTRQ